MKEWIVPFLCTALCLWGQFPFIVLHCFLPCRHGLLKKTCAQSACLLDPVPTNILKDCLGELLLILSTTINLSLESGFFPDIWKESVVIPLLKKQGLDLVFKNFRPISNLSFVSKLAEKEAADQIKSYLNEHDLFPSLQSVYWQHHSSGTALLKVKNDILMNMENQKVMLLVLLDLSAAFDTVDHRILLDRLRFDFGISGSAPNWIESYLSNRTQCIYIDGVLSSNCEFHKAAVSGHYCCLSMLATCVELGNIYFVQTQNH